jgi:TATA-box binding protein (TBP) (component of TFIID and TFIIIB)
METQRVLVDTDVVMNSALKSFYEDNVNVLSKEPYITTITCCFFLSNAPKSLRNIVFEVDETSNPLTRSLIDDVFGGKTMFFPKKESSSFHNCKIFTLKEKSISTNKVSNIAIKCFTNGTLHITGATKLHRAYEIAQMFCVLMEIVDGGSGIDDAYTIRDYSIQLINVHVGFMVPQATSIDLHQLYQQVKTSNKYLTQYDSNRHSGVIVKFLTSATMYVSILFFESGNILLCGIKSVNDLIESLKFAVDLIIENKGNLFVDTKCLLSKTLSKKVKGNKHFDYGQYIILK